MVYKNNVFFLRIAAIEGQRVSPCKMEDIWQSVLKSSQSATLEDLLLLQGQGKLVSLLVCKGM